LNTNLKSAFFLSQEVWPVFKKQKGGWIINISSVGGQFGGPRAPHYSSSKAALICLTKSLARLGAEHNIFVNAIAPGLILTDMTRKIFKSSVGRKLLNEVPLKRFGKPEDIANVVLFLVSSQSSYITGQIINVNGGYYM
jgi:NAD(P)-dependent dehydrogenase (short-subunit alcohol dehydrogenase family)